MAPSPRSEPDEWGRKNRTYSAASGFPGPRDPSLTPYTIPFVRATAAGTAPRTVLVMFAQGGKSEALLDLIGHRLDQRPAPILYVGPTRKFIEEQWEPRIMELLDQAPRLAEKVIQGKRMTKTRKVIAGVPLRLAHAGSSTALKSDPAALAVTDEADELMASVKGQGDPIGLIDVRGETYADFCHAIVSTPSRGVKDIERDEKTGLEFWAKVEADDLDSKVWSLWQEGTRYHWTWKCPHCSERFIPRFSCLHIPDMRKTSAAQARAEAYVVCPRNGCVIHDEHRLTMNETGVYVAPGQEIDEDGNVVGEPPENSTVSFWVSGLCSPFKSFGDRAAAYVAAMRSGDQETVQTVINAGFGELWAPVGGDLPEWEAVRARALPYKENTVPEGAVFLTSGVDVQKNRVIYNVRGWGPRQESWLITAGEVWGDTALDDVWTDLADVLGSTFDGLPIARMFVDAGYRPGKKDLVPQHKVYDFARRHHRRVYATKGYDHRQTPLSVNRIDVKQSGSRATFGLDLVRLDTDFFKSWVHERLKWPVDQPGGWHLFEGVSEEWCKQVVSEARVKKPSGGHQWVQVSRENHALDVESLSYAAAYMLGVQRLGDGRRAAPRAPETEQTEAPSARPQPQAPPSRPASRDGFLPRSSIWDR